MSPHPVSARLMPAALLLTVFSSAGLGAQVDSSGRIDVLNTRGERRPLANTTIESETLDEVRYRRTGSTRVESQTAAQVVFIDYGRGSETYENARAALSGGKLQNAINLFKACADNDKDPAWVGPHARLELAEALALKDGAGSPGARAAVDQFLSENADHLLTPRALLLLARYASSASDRSAADGAIQRLLSLVNSGKLSSDWTVRAHLGQGQNLLDAGLHVEAGSAFSSAEGAASAGLANLGQRADLEPVLKRLALEARSGSGAALLASGDLGAARSFFDRLARDGQDDPAILAAARNGKAEADFFEQQSARDDGSKVRALKQAQMGFARVAVTGAGVPDQHAKALYYLGRCAVALDDAGKETNGKTKAIQYFKDVEQRYPGTRWARLARESLP